MVEPSTNPLQGLAGINIPLISHFSLNLEKTGLKEGVLLLLLLISLNFCATMESAHKPVFIPAKKRVVRKTKGKVNNVPSNTVRRIHSYDIVTRTPRDDIKLSTSQSASPALSKSRCASQEGLALSGLSVNLCLSDSPQEASGSGLSINTGSKLAKTTSCIEDCLDSITAELESISDVNGSVWSENDNTRSSNNPTRTKEESIDADPELVTENSALNHPNVSIQDPNGYLTLMGTIKRGKKAGQSIDVKLNMSREELEEFEADLSKKLRPKEALFGKKSGIHIVALTLLCFPIVFLVSCCYAFYLGTFTWYNIYIHFSEERTIWHKIFICPFLVLTYPFWVLPAFLGIGIYAAVVQLSWHYDCWITEVQDLEKGFFGWLCASLRLSDCSPYEVVILNDVPVEKEKKNINTAVTTL